jgi:hypothetical protein
VKLGADRIIVLQAIGTEPLRRSPREAMGAGMVAMSRVLTRRLADDVGRYADAAELVILPAPLLEGVKPTDLGHADALTTEGRAQPVVPVGPSGSAVCPKAAPSRVRELTFSLRNAFRRW